MILEAYSQYLKAHYDPDRSSDGLLSDWLQEHLAAPLPISPLTHILQAELAQVTYQGKTWFVGTTDSGEKLLDNLVRFGHSYDNWQFTRWLHHLQASDFPKSPL